MHVPEHLRQRCGVATGLVGMVTGLIIIGLAWTGHRHHPAMGPLGLIELISLAVTSRLL